MKGARRRGADGQAGAGGGRRSVWAYLPPTASPAVNGALEVVLTRQEEADE